MNDNQQKLYEFLSQRNLYSGTYEDFSNNISLVDKRKALHGMLVDRQLFEGDFNTFDSYLNVKKKDPIVPGLEEVVGETRVFGDFGDTWLGDFAEDIYRSYKMNVAEGMSTDEILSMMGGDVPEEDVDTWFQAIKEGEKYGMSDERIAFNKKIKEEGDTVWNTLSSYVTSPTLIFEDAIGSLSRLGAAEVDTGTITKTVAAGAGIGAGVGSVVPGAGTAAGALVGGRLGLRTGIGIASGIVDATATFSGAIREELDRRGKEFTKENTIELLGDEEWVTEQRNKAIKGGAVIGVVDFITYGIAGSAAKSFTKPVAKALAAGGVEAAGGMAGEIGAETVRGEDLSPSAILAEGFGQLGMGAISGSRKVAGKGINSFSEIINPPTYTVSGRKYTKEQFLDFINSEKDLTTDNDGNPLSIDINNDKETQKLVDEKLADQKIDKEIDPSIQGEDRAKLVELEKERRQKSESQLQSNKKRVKEIDEEIDEILNKEREVAEPEQETTTEEAKPEEQPTEDQPTEEQPVDEPTPEPTPEPETEEDGVLGKLRGFAERVSRKRTYNQIRKDILSNPNNYFDPQRLSEIQEGLENMTMDELIDNMNETSLTNLMQAQDQTGIMAGIEALNRATAAGDTVAAQAIVEDLAKMGTSVGRLLRHFGELKSSTVKGMYDVIIGEVEKKGTTLNDAQKQRMQELLGPLLESQKQMKALIDLRQEALSMTEEEINQMEADYKKAFEDLQKNQDNLNNWVNANISRGYGELTTMLLQGNLLTPMSQATNVVANLVNLGLAIPREFLALSASKLASIFGKGIPSDRQYSFAAYMHGVRMFGRGFAEASREVFTGKTNDYVTEWRVQRGFLPLMSFLQAVHGTGIGTKMAKKLGVEIDAPISNTQRAKLLIQASFGVPAEAMFRLLSLGDTPFRRFMEGKVIYQEAMSRGLKGEAFNRFLKYPPEEVFQEAQREGRKLTFQEKTTTSEAAEGVVKGVTDFVGKVLPPGLAQFVIRSQVPYVRTPANILSETMKYSAFPFAMASFVKKFREGKTNDAYQDFAKGVLGLMMAKVASDLIAEGLISGDIEYEEDERKKNLAYDQFPPNSINISGLQRHLAGQDPSPQPEDRFYSYLKLGIPGVVLGSKATLQRSRIDEVEQGFDLIRQMTGIGSVSTINHILNQSFLQGVNNLTRLIGETDEDRLATSVEKWMFGTAKAMTSVALPNTLSAMNRAEREFLPDTRVLEEMDPTSRVVAKLKHTILDRTFKLEDAVPVRTNWKGQPIQQTPTGADPFMYHMFDVLKARNAEADPVSNEVYRLYYNLEEVSKVVSTPYFARSRKINIPDISSKKEARALRALAQQTGKEYSFLFDREFTSGRIQFNTAQINKLMEVAGQDRYRLVEEVMADPRYAQMSDKKKLEVLDNVNDFYRSTIELDNRGMFRPHTVAVLDFIEEMYRNERQ